MSKLHDMNIVRNRRFPAILLAIVCLLTGGFPVASQNWAVASSPPPSQRAQRLDVEDHMLVRKNPTGQSHSRIEIRKGKTAGEFDFKMEGWETETPSSLIGNGQISENRLRVSFADPQTGTEVGMKLTVDPSAPGVIHHKLSLNGEARSFTLDLQRAKSLAQEMRRLLAAGKAEEAARLRSQITATLSPKNEYVDFVRQVAASYGAANLKQVTRTLVSLTDEEIAATPVLAAMRTAAKMLAPFAIVEKQKPYLGTAKGLQSGVKKVGFVPNRATALMNAVPQTGVHVSCGVCDPLFVGGTLGCIALGTYGCPAGWPDWVCISLALACEAGVIYVYVICEEHCE